MMLSPTEKRQVLEDLILIVLGARADTPITLTHLQKEIFILWNFDPNIGEFIKFSKHRMGPYSSEIKDCVENPFFCKDCWIYDKKDESKGGLIKITKKGILKYKTLEKRMLEDMRLKQFLSAIKIVRKMYDKLTVDELLLLIYATYSQYTVNSEVIDRIRENKKNLLDRLLRKKFIDKKKYEELMYSQF